MIDRALLLLKEELESYLSITDAAATVVIDNIGLFETAAGNQLPDNIVLTLVNLEEESTLKNSSPLKKGYTSAVYQNPPVFLNLYVLFVCNYGGSKYVDALKRLSYVIQFVQSKNSFHYASDSGSLPPGEDILDMKFTLELYTLTFEQINHLWGSLGGRQMPFAMYKLRLIALTSNSKLREVPLIEEIENNNAPINR